MPSMARPKSGRSSRGPAAPHTQRPRGMSGLSNGCREPIPKPRCLLPLEPTEVYLSTARHRVGRKIRPNGMQERQSGVAQRTAEASHTENASHMWQASLTGIDTHSCYILSSTSTMSSSLKFQIPLIQTPALITILSGLPRLRLAR